MTDKSFSNILYINYMSKISNICTASLLLPFTMAFVENLRVIDLMNNVRVVC